MKKRFFAYFAAYSSDCISSPIASATPRPLLYGSLKSISLKLMTSSGGTTIELPPVVPYGYISQCLLTDEGDVTTHDGAIGVRAITLPFGARILSR